MSSRARYRALLILVVAVSSYAAAQVYPTAGNGQTAPGTPTRADLEQQRFDTWFMNDKDWANRDGKPEEPNDSVSKLDLMAPGKARSEYNKGLTDLTRKNFNTAVTHFQKAISVFPKYVSAHNGLGTAYMNLAQNERARAEFQIALSLDDHLPNTYSNLSRACLALQDYSAAVPAIQKASELSPLNLQLRVLLVYAQLMNRDYSAVIATTELVHQQKHDQAAMVHYFAAAAHQAEHNLEGMQTELQYFLQEDPKSPNSGQAHDFLAQIDAAKNANHAGIPTTTVSYATDASAPGAARQVMAHLELQRQVQMAECETCATNGSEPDPGTSTTSATSAAPRARSASPWTLRRTVDEVGVLFAVTDGGRAVSDLHLADVKLLDDRKAPAVIVGFRNEAELPLRLGFVIDTSTSVTSRFTVEQDAAAEFLQQVLTTKNDLAFVTGVANSVLLVQDFTNSKDDVSTATHKLAPSGGTALWDAVTFAAEKLGRRDTAPVARILVVVSDGEDNSSSVTLQHAIQTAQHEQVTVYTVSTRDDIVGSWDTLGDRALQALAKQTGGAFFLTGSLGRLKRNLGELQQVIRSRYLISYKPAQFSADGHYRPIEIAAQRSGHKLRVYARKGYFAGPKGNSAN